MIFKELTIKNFRGIKNCTIAELARINLLVGKNNSGKSSLLEAIFLLLSPGNPSLIVTIDNARSILHDDENDFRFAFYKLNYENTIDLYSQLVAKDGVRELRISPIKNSSSESTTVNARDLARNSTTSSGISTIDSRINEVVTGLEFVAKLKKFQTPKTEYRTTIRLKRSAAGVQFETAPPKNLGNDTISGTLQTATATAPFDLTQRLTTIIIEKKKEELIQALRGIDGRIKDFELGTKNMIYFDIGIERLIPANLMGDGILKLLNIYANIYATKNGCLLIDELDNGFHFETLKLLWKIIFSAAKQYNCQIFTTSHNFELIKYLTEFLKDESFYEYRNDIACYSLIKNSEDDIISSRYDFEKMDFAINHDIEIRGIN